MFASSNTLLFLGLIFSNAFFADCSAWRQFSFFAEQFYSGYDDSI